MEFNRYLKQTISCGCSREHTCDIEDIIMEEGALKKVAPQVKKDGYQKAVIIQDEITKKIAGDAVLQELINAGILCEAVTLSCKELIPDERAIGSILMKLPEEKELLIAVGSGTINDLTKFISYQLDIPYYIVGTVPSMDGYTSNVAAMITDHTKTTYVVRKPRVVFGDLSILREAPMEMIAAGVGDIIGKYVCLADWKLSHLITGEYYCPYIEGIVRESIEKVKEAAVKIKNREKEAVGALMEALVLSGIAMSFAGNSRPASGSEHHLSHYWEMMFLQNGEHGALHGTKVGIGTVVSLRLYEYWKENPILIEAGTYRFDREEWEKKMESVYGEACGPVLLLEKETGKNDAAMVEKRLAVLREKKDEVDEVMKNLPSSKEVADLLKSLGAPWTPSQIGVEEKMFQNSVLYAKELRNRYGLLQLLKDTGKIEEFAQKAADECYKGDLS